MFHICSFHLTGFTSVVLSTIERRYRFSSTAAGLIASTFDMAVLVSVLFISYFGGKGHKPRWLGISLIVQGAGESLSSYLGSLVEEKKKKKSLVSTICACV